MTASPAMTLRRETELADVLADATAYDRECLGLLGELEHMLGSESAYGPYPETVTVQKPVRIADLVTNLSRECAVLFTLIGAELGGAVERQLTADDEWGWCDWTSEKRAAVLEHAFAAAGAPDRFVRGRHLVGAAA